MQRVIRPLARVAAVLVAAPFLAFASAMAPQHVHEAGPGPDGHSVAHSHFGPHEVTAYQDAGTEIEHDVEHVVWLDSPALHQGGFRLDRQAACAAVTGVPVPCSTRWIAVEHDDAAPPHGPPRLA